MPWTERRGGRRPIPPLLSSFLLFSIAASAVKGVAQAVPNAAPLPGLPQPPGLQVQPRFAVVLDAAHGGADRGAQLGGQMQEKDLVLMLASRLAAQLKGSGMEVTTTRTADTDVAAQVRAEVANGSRAAACLSFHATGSGSGVHLFTASLAPAAAVPFLRWDAAQAPSIQQSLKLSAEINSAMTHAEIPVTLGRTSLQPLNSFACPAVAVEIAPLGRSTLAGTPLSDPAYQARIVNALAAALNAWKRDWSVQP